jgi:hypothetical protein
MGPLLQYLVPNETSVWLAAVGLFVLVSIAVVWALAMILARLSIVVQHDQEMKAHFGVAIALLLYGCLATVLVIELAMEYKAQDVGALYLLPWCLADAVALLVAAALFGRLQTTASARLNEERS